MRDLKSPREKYTNDPYYCELVNVLESFLERAHFSPSELREACILASINYEMRHIRTQQIPTRVYDALRVLNEFTVRKDR